MSDHAPPITQQFVRSILDYEPETGIFTWRERSDVRPQWNGRYAGKRAGYEWTANGGGRYRSIRILDWPFPEHRVAWLWMTGAMPVDSIDHTDLNGLNNRWGNLREATKVQNGHNTSVQRRNTSGYKGVSFHKETGRFRAYIQHNGRQKWLGYHNTAEAAHAAYVDAVKELRGEFGRVR
ncbi:HNH endonuclease [Xanthobacter agilis]|uniref:AP2/ERF domain-containing protein n=1 Tax=Xanthobacter agilis TaxID=47492 RepID=A0ABU0LFT5_XANAG|nr:HNH endonuclease [Xanthobacter agilis]MDQ0505996.1 hypothetical protein [Xanthobacter agilis]